MSCKISSFSDLAVFVLLVLATETPFNCPNTFRRLGIMSGFSMFNIIYVITQGNRIKKYKDI